MDIKISSPCKFVFSKNYGRYCSQHNCKKHIVNNTLPLQKYLRIFIDSSVVEYNCPIGTESLYENFDRLWSKYPETINAKIVTDIMCHLFDEFMLYRITNIFDETTKRNMRKSGYSIIIFNIMHNLWVIKHDTKFISIILPKFQKAIRYGPHILYNSNNNECPFTLSKLNELPQKELFSFYDNKQIYTFHAPELHYYICKTLEYKNPYTRQEINKNDLRRLFRIMTLITWKEIDQSWSSERLTKFLAVYYNFYKIPYEIIALHQPMDYNKAVYLIKYLHHYINED